MQAKIARVLQDLGTLIHCVQEGKLATRGQVADYAGVWRELVAGINDLIEAFVTPMTQINQTLALIAQGDFTGTLHVDYQGDFQVMMQQVQMMTAKLTGVVINVKTAAQDVAQRSREMRVAAEQMSEGASQQASATEEVSASMQEMAANIRQTANNARLTESMAVKSAEDAHAGKRAVMEIIQAMEAIANRISVVQEIAAQTNMLSLNATIEAAKAQEYGKGFTVVASSVRDLARQSREAADEIRSLVHDCVILSSQAGDVLQRLVPNSEKTAELVQDICAASQEQSTGVEHVNQAVQQLDIVTQHNAATSEELASTAETLTAQADVLQQAMAFFTVKERIKSPERTEEEELLQCLKRPEHAHLVELLKAALTTSPPAGQAFHAIHHDVARRASDKVATFERGDGAEDDLDKEFEHF